MSSGGVSVEEKAATRPTRCGAEMLELQRRERRVNGQIMLRSINNASKSSKLNLETVVRVTPLLMRAFVFSHNRVFHPLI